ncbi:hypothetical protein Tco_0052711 [Tanacetum coccineum]
MADENVPAPAPTRSDDQILPFTAWVPIEKSNHVLDLQKRQKNRIIHIAMDILQNINFFRAFTTSASVPASYIQQFWNTLTYVEKAGTYRFQLDEDWFTLDANLLREALEITPIDQAHPFVSPPLGDVIMDFVNELGYPEARLLGMIDPDIQLFRCFGELLQVLMLTMLNLYGKSSCKLCRPFLLIRPIWAVPLRRAGKASLTLFLIVGSRSVLSVTWEEFTIFTKDQHLRFILLKKTSDSVISNSSPKHDLKVAAEKEGNKKSASTKQPKPKPAIEKSSKPAHAPKPKVTKVKPSKASTAKPPKPKHAKEKSTKATPLQKAGKGIVAKVRNVKSSFQLVDEPDEEPAHSEPEPEPEQEGVAIQEPVTEVIRPLLVVERKGKAIVTEEQAAQSLLALHTPNKRSTMDQFILQRRTLITKEASTRPSAQPLDDTYANIIYDSPSLADAKTCAKSDKTSSGGDTEIAGSDPSETLESRPQPEQVRIEEDQAGPDPGISRVALAGPDPEPTHDEFITDSTLSSMKNLEDAYAIGDQFINDKSTDDEPGKLNVEAEVVSMVTVPIYQASSSVPPLLTSVIDLSSPKPASSTTQAPIFTATTTTTPTTLPPPPQQQNITELELVECVAGLEKKLSDLEHNNKNLDNATRNLRSRVYTLELRDLSHKINEAVRENVKEAV